jgi:Ca2+-binding RTX toxin-like protein
MPRRLLWTALVLVATFTIATPAQAQEAPVCLSAKEKLNDKPETWEGKQTRDSVTGLRGGDNLYGQGGSDLVNGGRDNDKVDGGTGNDTLCGGRGDDSIYGGEGDDLIYGEEESDFVDAGTGNDRILGSAFSDDLYGGEGDDIVAGGGGLSNDNIDGGEGNDLCITGEDDTIFNCEATVDDPKGADSDERPHDVGQGERGASTKITLDLSGGDARGRVTSEDPDCVGGRHVRFNTYEFGFISVRLDETTTNPAGHWQGPFLLTPALYFAQVDSSPGCRYAVSATLPL